MSGKTTRLVNFPTPPRLTGDTRQDQLNLARWTEDFFQAAKLRFERIEQRLDAVTVLQALESSATLPEAVAKINEIIAAAAFPS